VEKTSSLLFLQKPTDISCPELDKFILLGLIDPRNWDQYAVPKRRRQITIRKIPEDRKSHWRCSGSLKQRTGESAHIITTISTVSSLQYFYFYLHPDSSSQLFPLGVTIAVLYTYIVSYGYAVCSTHLVFHACLMKFSSYELYSPLHNLFTTE